METFLKDLLFAVFVAAVPVLSFYLSKLIEKLFKKIDVEVEDTHISEALNNIAELILQVVASTSQTYVDSLKASGSFDKEAQEKAFSATKETILLLLSDEYKSIIESLYDDVDRWIDVQIESTVRQLKND